MILLITKYNLSPKWMQILIFLIVYFILIKLTINFTMAECMNDYTKPSFAFGPKRLTSPDPNIDPIGAEIYKTKIANGELDAVRSGVPDIMRFNYVYNSLASFDSVLAENVRNTQALCSSLVDEKTTMVDSKLSEIVSYMNSSFEQDREEIKNYMNITDKKIEDIREQTRVNLLQIQAHNNEIVRLREENEELKMAFIALEEKFEHNVRSMEFLQNLMTSVVGHKRK